MKKKIIDIGNEELSVCKPAGKIKEVRPCGCQVLVELMTAQEALGTRLELAGVETGSPQGYVKAIGPMANPNHGIQVGDRVLLQGTFVPVPTAPDERRQALMLPDMIKAVLVE